MTLAAGQLYGPDYFIIIAYFLLMLGVGLYFYRYMKAMKDYFTGGLWFMSHLRFTRDSSSKIEGFHGGGGRVRAIRFARR